jgi:Spy/CpxP family protein refolding chaperone
LEISAIYGGGKNMKRLGVLFVVIMLVATAAMAMAGPRRCGSGMGSGSGMRPGCGTGPYGLANLDLSPEQSAKIQALREARLKEVSPLRNQVFSKRAELRLLWVQINPDQDKIRTKQKEISRLRDQIQEKATQYRLELRKVLTPEQRAQLMAFRLERGCGQCGQCGKMGCW